MRALSHTIGIDDAPFSKQHKGDVPIVGAVYAGLRLEGVLSTKIRRDGQNATRAIYSMIERSRFVGHLQAVLLQGIALGGFNVVDIQKLSVWLGLPVLVVIRKMPDLTSVERALTERVSGGARKWKLIQKAGAIEALGEIFVQRANLSLAEAKLLCEKLTPHSLIPEPLRAAHIIAGGVTLGENSRGRA